MEDSVDKHPVTPGAVLPARELLGDMLSLIDRENEALAAYESALKISPNRARSLRGAQQAAAKIGQTMRSKGSRISWKHNWIYRGVYRGQTTVSNYRILRRVKSAITVPVWPIAASIQKSCTAFCVHQLLNSVQRAWYRIKGNNVKIRLIIDGYDMDVYNGLLFGGAAVNVNTKDQFQWVRQGGDIRRYKGHRAHDEIIDQGGGYAVVDRIVFSDGGQPPYVPPVAAKLLSKVADVEEHG